MKRTFVSLALIAAAGVAFAATATPTVATAVVSEAPVAVETKGKCQNGKAFTISYAKDAVTINGERVGVYSYQGPLGKGSVPSKDSFDVAKSYVCKQNKAQWLPFGNHGE